MLINDSNFEIIAQFKHQRLGKGYPIDIREKRKQNTRKSSGRSHPATPALILHLWSEFQGGNARLDSAEKSGTDMDSSDFPGSDISI